jgi:hypothetical protein
MKSLGMTAPDADPGRLYKCRFRGCFEADTRYLTNLHWTGACRLHNHKRIGQVLRGNQQSLSHYWSWNKANGVRSGERVTQSFVDITG